MSNRDWPGPYWQEQRDDASAGQRGRRGDQSSEPSPWDEEGGFWRGSSARTNGSASPRGNGSGGPVSGGRSSRHAADRIDVRPGRRESASRGDRSGSRSALDRNRLRLSQAAGDLRGRLTGRGAAKGEREEWSGESTQAWRDPETRGYRGTRRAGSHGAAYGAGDGRATGQTAVRDGTGLTQRVGPGWGRDDGRRGRGRRDEGKRRFHDDGTPMTAWERFVHRLIYGNWWRRWTWKKALAVFFGGIVGLILLGVVGLVIMYEMTPVPDATAESALWQSSTVYFADHQLLGTFSNGGFQRFNLTESQIPKPMTEAITAIEDRNFYHEGGISVTGLMRAAYSDLFGSGNLQGGSTITMQYAKNYYANVNSGQNVTTKLKEIFIAMKLAHMKSKDWIMQQYLNVVPFGGQISGLGAAALYYFNINLTKPGTTLSVPQAAFLAAWPNAPGYFSTDPGSGQPYQALVQRYQAVLAGMVRDGNITQQHATEYGAKLPKITPPTNINGWTGYKGYLMSMVEQELTTPKPYGYGLSPQKLETGGYHITTTFSWKQVVQLADSVKAEQAQMKAEGVPFPVYDRIGAVLEQAKTGAITAVYGGPGYPADGSAKSIKWCDKWNCQYNMAEVPEPVGSSFKPYVLATAVSEGMNAFTSQLNGFEPIFIPLGPSGQMTLSRLSAPPTCTTRPCTSVSYFNNLYWFPFTEQGENFGKALTPNVAAALSSDSAFEDLAHRVNIDDLIKMAKNFGVGQNPFVLQCAAAANAAEIVPACNDWSGQNGMWTNFHYNSKAQTAGSPAIALGESPLTAVEQATTFATLGDDGVYHSPHVVASVTQGTKLAPSDVITRVVLSKAAAANADWALSFDNTMPGATGLNVTVDPGGLIAKTGTLGSGANSSQAWFNGAVPNQLVGGRVVSGVALSVALFTNDPATEVLDNLPQAGVNGGSLGGGWPALIFNNYFLKMFPNGPTTPPFQNLEVKGYPFQKWVLVTPPKKVCRQFQFGFGGGHGNGDCKQNCVPTFGQQCRGNPGPNPSPSCTLSPGQCNKNPGPSTSPNPSPSCGGILPCNSPSPTPSPGSPSPTCTPPSCQSTGAARASPAVTAKTAAVSAKLLAMMVSLPEKSAVGVASGASRVVAS